MVPGDMVKSGEKYQYKCPTLQTKIKGTPLWNEIKIYPATKYKMLTA